MADLGRLARNIGIGVAAILCMVFLDWIIPGPSILPDILTLNFEKIKGVFYAVLILIVVIIALTIWAIKRSEGLWKFNQLKDRYPGLYYNRMIVRLNELINKIPGLETFWFKRKIVPDYLPEVERENIIILFSLINYLKRLFITYAKMSQVTTARRVFVGMWGDIGHHRDINELKDEIYITRNKGKIGNAEYGWFEAYRQFCNHVNEISRFLKNYRELIAEGQVEVVNKTYGTTASNLLTTLHKIVGDDKHTGILQRRLEALEEREKALGAHQVIKAWMYLALDQDNPYGQFEHYYKFANRGGQKYEINYYTEYVERNYSKTRNWFEPWRTFTTEEPERHPNPKEVYEAYAVQGITPMKVCDWILFDWEGLIRQLRFGEFAYWSKDVSAYVHALSELKEQPHREGRSGFGKLEFYPGSTNFYYVNEHRIPMNKGFKEQTVAFDRRALVHPGYPSYPGRRSFREGWQDIKKYRERNPYPAVSSRGMSLYIPQVVEREADDVKAAQASLMKWVRDKDISITNSNDAWSLFAPLGEKEEGHAKKE